MEQAEELAGRIIREIKNNFWFRNSTFFYVHTPGILVLQYEQEPSVIWFFVMEYPFRSITVFLHAGQVVSAESFPGTFPM